MECEYAIHWTDAAGKARVHDPIITIKPSLFDDDIESAIGIIAGATIGAAATFLLEGSALVERVAALIVGAVIGGFAGWLFLRKR
jgi:outer membrane lipoprotein SlyB